MLCHVFCYCIAQHTQGCSAGQWSCPSVAWFLLLSSTFAACLFWYFPHSLCCVISETLSNLENYDNCTFTRYSLCVVWCWEIQNFCWCFRCVFWNCLIFSTNNEGPQVTRTWFAQLTCLYSELWQFQRKLFEGKVVLPQGDSKVDISCWGMHRI